MPFSILEFPVMIVLGGWLVRDMRLAKLRSRSAAAGVQGEDQGEGGHIRIVAFCSNRITTRLYFTLSTCCDIMVCDHWGPVSLFSANCRATISNRKKYAKFFVSPSYNDSARKSFVSP